MVQNQPPYHNSALPYDFPKKLVVTFLIISMPLSPLHLAGFQILCPVLILLFQVQQITLLCIFLGNWFFKYINPALFWPITLTTFFMSPSSMCNVGKCTFWGLINGVFITFFLSWNKQLHLITMKSSIPLAMQCSSSTAYCWFHVPTCQSMSQLA